ncbi:MAG: universal stress protein [Bryobacteraceae bacterium]|jgi:nucleotide-binding universal stress UspA family protein
MPQIKKILFPVDFSPSCLGAARHVEAFAGRFEAEIMLLHAVGMGEHNLAEELFPRSQEQLSAYLTDELKYFTTERLCVLGNPANEIVAEARRWGPDLVMMPTHGLGPFRRFLIGSVTGKVLHDLDCPVWTSAHSEAAPPLEQIHCRRILCALDLNQEETYERSRSILEWAAWLAGEEQGELGIVHATAPLPAGYLPGDLEEELTQSVAQQAKKRVTILQEAVGTDARVIVGSGDTAKVIACAARDFQADLVVIGRHGVAGAGEYLRRHTYAILSESPCPVISV